MSRSIGNIALKKIFLTLDLEEDYGSASKESTYYSHSRSQDFIKFIKDNRLRVTLFITGEILDKYQELIQPYQSEKAYFQLELHAYNHEDVYDDPDKRIENIRRGIDAYINYFGHKPKIFRAPDGLIFKREIELLIKNGILYGSDLFPTKFPGRFDNLHIPRSPFKIKGSDFYEMPFSVTKKFRIPIALSYIQLFGFQFFKCLLSNEDLDSIIFDFHLHDLFPEQCYREKNLALKHKIAYFRASRGKYAFRTFEKIVNYYKKLGFDFYLMNRLIQDLLRENIQELSYEEIFPKGNAIEVFRMCYNEYRDKKR